jgi:hypothetical protein
MNINLISEFFVFVMWVVDMCIEERWRTGSALRCMPFTPAMAPLLMEGVAQCRIDGGNTHYIC